MEQKIQKAYASAPKTWLWQLLAAFIIACLLAWSGTAVRVSTPTSNGLEVAKNIISGIFHPSGKLLFTLGTNGVPYLLLETFCIAFLGTIVGAVISLPLSFLSASNLVPRPHRPDRPSGHCRHPHHPRLCLWSDVHPRHRPRPLRGTSHHVAVLHRHGVQDVH